MRKYAIIFLFLLILLSGCSNTSSTDLTLEPPIFNLNEIYRGTLELELDEAITYEGNLTLLIDGEEYIEDTLILGLGEHLLEAYVGNDKNKSEKVSFMVNIIDENNKDYVDIYSEPNLESNIKDVMHIDSIKIIDDYDYTYEFLNGELISWERIKFSDSEEGYIIDEFNGVSNYSDFKNNIVLRLVNGEEIVFNEKLDNCWYSSSDDFSQYGYFLIYKRNESREESSIIISSKTGKQYETLYDFTFSPSDKKIIARDRFRNYYSEEENIIQVLSITEDEIIYEWTGKFSDFGTGDISWIDENNIQLKRYIAIENEWELVDSNFKEVTEKLTNKNGEWKLSKLSNEEKIYDTILIYESINKDSNIIGSIYENEIDNITFLNIYEIIDNKLILWFEIKTADGKTGYINRGLRDSEYPYYDNETTEFHFILENGEYVTISDHLENDYDYYLVDGLSEVNYYTIYATYDGEGHRGKFINGKTGQSFYIDGFPVLSNTKNKFIIANFDLEAGYSWNGIAVYNINENGIVLEFSEGSNDWGPANVQWIDDYHILFTKVYFDPFTGHSEEVDAELILTESSWIMRDIQK